MIPFDMAPRPLEVPASGEPTIMVATGDEPRHVRFALRIQQAFGKDVIGWYQLTRQAKQGSTQTTLIHRAKHLVKRVLRRIPPGPSRSIFLEEIEQLRRHAVVEARVILSKDAHDEFFVRELLRLRPCFFLTLGGGLYGSEVLAAVRGVAINQQVEIRDLASQSVRKHGVVAIEVRDEFSAGFAQPHISCDGGGRMGVTDEANPGVASRRTSGRRRFVCGAIISEDEQLEIIEMTRQHALDRFRD